MPFDKTSEQWIPWNKGKLVGQKSPLKPQQVWAIRVRLQLAGKKRDLALFNLAIDSKLRGCDLLSLRVFPRGNMDAWSKAGSGRLGCRDRPTPPTQCAGQKRR